VTRDDNARRRAGARGRVTKGAEDESHLERRRRRRVGDRGGDGAGEDICRRPRPKRSLLFVWHSGEESGLLGSRYFADHPTVPMDRIVTQLNIDMIGRNRDDKRARRIRCTWWGPIASAPQLCTT